MKKFILVLLFLTFSCKEGKETNPLVIPPNFAEVPDPNTTEQPTQAQKDADITKLKDLLLKSE